MDNLPANYQRFRDGLREILVGHVPPAIRERVRAGRELSRADRVESQRILNAHGLAVPHWPSDWGGRNWDTTQLSVWRDELWLSNVPEPLPFNVNMLGPVLATFGTTEQQQRFLPATANLDIWWAQGFSEPEAGSDLASLKTRAERDGDHFVVNGQKTWTTLAQHADWMFTLVRTSPLGERKQAGISFLLIDLSSPGVEVRPIKLIDGSHEVNEVFLDNVRVPVENLVADPGSGWSIAKYLLGNERSGAARLGLTKSTIRRIKELAHASPAGSTTLLGDPIFAARLAELENATLALEIARMRLDSSSKDGKPDPASSLLKLRGSDLQQWATELLMDTVVATGAIPGDQRLGVSAEELPPTVASYLNYRKTTIYGGSSEVQRNIIASAVLGL